MHNHHDDLVEERLQITRRPLSAVEKIVWTMSRRIPFNFIVTARIRGAFSIEAARAAARDVRDQYRGLVARIVREQDGSMHLCHEDVLDFSVEEREASADDDWQREVLRQLALPFDTWSGPLARLVVVRNADFVDLLAVCDHTVADGLSAVNLIRDLCERISKPDAPPIRRPLSESLPKCLPAEVFELNGVKQARRFGPFIVDAVGWYLKLKRRLFRQPEPRLDVFPDRPVLDDLRTVIEGMSPQVRTWSLSIEQTRALAARCRLEKTTVHAALCVAIARGYEDCGAFGKRRHRIIESPINARKNLLPHTHEGCGLYNLITQTKITGKLQTDFWGTARQFRKRLEKSLTTSELFSGAILLDDILGNDDVKVRSAAAGYDIVPKNHDVSISNLGRLTAPVDLGDLKIESFHGPAVLGRGRAPVLGVATFDDRMTFILTSHESAGGAATLQRIFDTAMRQLEQAIR
jgi:hypothetical protein